MNIWNSITHWLRDAPIADAVDRRNAPTMQVLFLLMGLTIPASWIYFIATGGVPAGGRVLMTLAMVTATLALVCVVMIRKGLFRTAVILFLGALLLSQEINHLQVGFKALASNQLDQLLVLIVGGLVLGRRTLWLIFLALLVITASGFAVDAHRLLANGHPTGPAYSHVLSVLFGYLAVAVVLDRTITSLRESLAESNARGRDLQREMAERERAQAQLIHAQKVEATGRLASGISHDFNNILDVIQGYAAQRYDIPDIENRDAREAAFSKALNGIDVAATRAAAITRKLLTFSRNDVARPQVFDASQVIAELQPMLRQLFPRPVSLDLPGDTESFHVRLDRSEFEMMVLNIAANARDAMDHGGHFRIELGGRADGIVEIALSDTGHGMDHEVQQRIFEPFFSTKAATDGTGLGLAVIRDLVKAAGGDIGVQSTVGQGSTFHIRLPSAEPPPSA